MNIIESFEAYIVSQRTVGINFLILGGVLIAIVIIAHFAFPSTTLAIWFKRSLIACGILIALGGWSYGNFNNKVSEKGKAHYSQNSTEFVQTELVRMEKVVKQFPYYQITFATLIVIALLVVLFVPSPQAKGLAFAVILLMAGCLIVEQISHSSIMEYAESLN